jgi:hypothetical protein
VRSTNRKSPIERFIAAVGLWVQTPIWILKSRGLMRTRSRRDPFAASAPEDGDDGAAGGVTARLPKVPPSLSPGYACAIPRDSEPE